MAEDTEFSPEVIAFYLPQYHEIPENNEWWGKGFTEWTNVKKAIPLFKGHEQPVEPGELGYYNLLNADVRNRQANLAKEYGVTAFCYWHYWFGGGKKLLEKPLQEVLKLKEPDFPFCLGWANESWTGVWHGNPGKVLAEQTYPGEQDIIDHFNYILPAFKDKRYLKIDGRPFFLVYRPLLHPDLEKFTSTFNSLAKDQGFKGIHFVATNVPESWDIERFGFHAIAPSYHNGIVWRKKKTIFQKVIRKTRRKFINSEKMRIYNYSEASEYFMPGSTRSGVIYPVAVPRWDNSPRSGKKGVIFKNSTPENYRKHFKEIVDYSKNNGGKNPVIMIKSWNEWAEGNFLEPDKKWERKYLEITKDILEKAKNS